MAVITVDSELCTGCGLCESTCPEVFKIGDDNIAQVIGSSCANANVNEVVTDCPVDAIKVTE